MVGGSLLQRLEGDEPFDAHRGSARDEAAVMDSVLDNLRVILNCRQGCCETRPDFGLTDLGGVTESYQESVALVARDVERQIRLFEPRLRNVLVRSIEDNDSPLDLVLHIDGDLNYDDRTVHVAINSVLGTDGYMRVNG